MARDECHDLFFYAMASSVIYYSTHARQNEIYLFYTSKVLKLFGKIRLLCDDICHLYSTIIAHAQEPIKLLHLYTLVS